MQVILPGFAVDIKAFELLNLKAQFLGGVDIKLQNVFKPPNGLISVRAIAVHIELRTVRNKFRVEFDQLNR